MPAASPASAALRYQLTAWLSSFGRPPPGLPCPNDPAAHKATNGRIRHKERPPKQVGIARMKDAASSNIVGVFMVYLLLTLHAKDGSKNGHSANAFCGWWQLVLTRSQTR